MSHSYKELNNLNMPAIEQEILAQWKEEQCFEESVKIREGAPTFVFYEGPPSANGMPGIHHVISRTLKDLVCRYKTMRGFQVKRKAGWDTHGLPVELGVEKELGITKEEIGKKITIEDYNQKCREVVMRYKDKWEDITEKMGYWVDMGNPYITFTNEYIETLWWALKELYKKNLLYKSVSIQPYSPAAGTGLSSHELNQPGAYKDVKDTTIVAMFKAERNERAEMLWDAVNEPDADIHFLAWTTTPWTLPSNCGLTVGANIDYVLVKTFNQYTHQPVLVILAEALLHKYFKEEGRDNGFDIYSKDTKIIPWSVLGKWKGAALEGMRYEQLLPFEGNTRAIAGGDPWRVVTGDFVTTEDGTGIVHTAPAFGADDYRMGKKYDLGMLVMVDKQGKFSDYMGEFSGRYIKNYKDDDSFKDVDVDIAVKLKLNGQAFKIEKYEHSYPHCWRTDKPVIYYPLDAWFIRTTAMKERMAELNKTIQWKPKATGEGRFGNWLENMVDWNLSRSRYWGTPLPIWTNADGTEYKCIGSIEELRREVMAANSKLGINQELDAATLDLHKPYVDKIILVSSDGKPMEREPDLIDVWFDSGAMPYAQLHYPFAHGSTGEFKHSFPADFIAEGVDQTRGWFYTLHALSTMLFDSVAYKTVISNGLVLDKNGNKMSKRLGNAVDPFSTIEKYSADATRWYLITNAAPWDSLRFDIDGIKEVQRKFFGTLFNTCQFFALYANLDRFQFKERYIPVLERPEIDRWIISMLHSLIKNVQEAFDNYEPTQAGRLLEVFLDEQLSNWYVRLCRRRFWKGEYEHDKICAYQTLYECLETIALLMAPIAPFFADWLYRNLNAVTGRQTTQSVHHAVFPVSIIENTDPQLEERMQLAQDICSLTLSIRKKVNIKVRQPLTKIFVPVSGSSMQEQISKVEDLIKNEVNVKAIEYITDAHGVIKKKIKANFKSLGARLGAKMKVVAGAIAQMSQEEIGQLEKAGAYVLQVNGEAIEILTTDVEIIAEDIPGWSVANKNSITVALDISVTPALLEEGIARELVNKIQKIRKEADFAITDRINVAIEDSNVNIETFASIRNAVINFNQYLCAEILANNITFVSNVDNSIEVDVNETTVNVSVTKNL
jgi:isoleucyl-tRNA synthetase